jgi:hypothetical protein
MVTIDSKHSAITATAHTSASAPMACVNAEEGNQPSNDGRYTDERSKILKQVNLFQDCSALIFDLTDK